MLCYISAITTITHCAMLQALLRQPTACPFDADNFFMKWVAVKKKKSQNKKNFTRISHIKTLFGYFFYQHILPRKSLKVLQHKSVPVIMFSRAEQMISMHGAVDSTFQLCFRVGKVFNLSSLHLTLAHNSSTFPLLCGKVQRSSIYSSPYQTVLFSRPC